MAKHLRRTSTARRVGRAVTVPVVLAGAMALTAPAFAGKPAPSGSGGTSSASCSAAPNPVAVNSDYTVTARGLVPGDIVNVQVSDSSGSMSIWQVSADSSGVATATGHAYRTGPSTVNVKKPVRKAWTTLASCSFSVV